jgi:lipopolysaccharide heptosyltransferase I
VLKKTPGRILIVKPSSLGDIVHTLPVLQVLHATFPQARIDWVVAKGFEGLLEHNPLINRLWIIHKDRWKNLKAFATTTGELSTLTRSLRNERYDLVIDLQGLLRSGLITRATQAPVRIGFSEAREGSRLFYTHTVSGGRNVHAVDRYLKLVATLGCDTSDVRFPFPLVKEPQELQNLKQSLGAYAIFVPGARKPANRWPAERFGELASRLRLPTVIIGSTADASLADSVVSASNDRALSLAGKTDIPGLIHLIRGCSFMVCNDTGPMHIAAALRVPVIALFGPANPARTGPYGQLHRVVCSDIPCAPCYKRECKKPFCMEAISVDAVEHAIMRAISERSTDQTDQSTNL